MEQSIIQNGSWFSCKAADKRENVSICKHESTTRRLGHKMNSATAQRTGLDWGLLDKLFQAAACMPDADRHSFIERETAGRPELRVELLTLLETHVQAGHGPLSRAVGTAFVDLILDRRQSLLGR